MPALAVEAVRDRCYRCFRPKGACFCGTIPRIDNKTEVLILQHVRERFHPFNTARIVRRALANSRLLSDYVPQLAAGLPLRPRAGLLYPGPGATLLSDLPADERPDQLVVLDGTWHHTKTLLRDIPVLGELPRYKIVPSAPSRYRIRREPSAGALSTVEATVAALQTLEPETPGWDRLLAAFECMIERQLAHPKSPQGWRCNERRRGTRGNIPRALLGDLANLVVAYGESSPGECVSGRSSHPRVYWAAQRLGSGEQFACAIRPEAALQAAFLERLELTPDDFARAPSLGEAGALWSAFQRPADILAVYHPGVVRLLRQISSDEAPCLVLKSIERSSEPGRAELDQMAIECGSMLLPGRAGKRLAKTIAYVRRLNMSPYGTAGGRASFSARDV